MATVSNITQITFDDVLIKPRFSSIESRESIDTGVSFLGLKLTTPIISANMDTVTDINMATAMYKAGGLGILHRFMSDTDLRIKIARLFLDNLPVAFSVGIKNLEKNMSTISYTYSIRTHNNIIVAIDVAHGHHARVADLIKDIKYNLPSVKVIAGNVATWQGYKYLVEAGADAVKVGIGPGAACTTREVTGVGVPQLSAIMEIADYRSANYEHGPLIIADGGIKTSGDIVKAIAAGADLVMLGSLLAGCPESPQEPRSDPTGQKWHRYRGQSTIGSNAAKYTVEGVDGWVREKPPVAEVVKSLTAGLRSGMSYVGATSLKELQEDTEFVLVSPGTRIESDTRIALTI